MSHTFASRAWPLEPKGPHLTVILLFTCVHALQASNSQEGKARLWLQGEDRASRPSWLITGKLHTKALQRVENPRSQDCCLTVLQICQSQEEGTVARGPHPQRILRLTLLTGLALRQE